jgi:hypothetical protein
MRAAPRTKCGIPQTASRDIQGNMNEAIGLRPGQPNETRSDVPSHVTSVTTTTTAVITIVRRRGIPNDLLSSPPLLASFLITGAGPSPRREQFPVPLGDDVDGAVDHLDGGLVVDRVRGA